MLLYYERDISLMT